MRARPVRREEGGRGGEGGGSRPVPPRPGAAAAGHAAPVQILSQCHPLQPAGMRTDRQEGSVKNRMYLYVYIFICIYIRMCIRNDFVTVWRWRQIRLPSKGRAAAARRYQRGARAAARRHRARERPGLPLPRRKDTRVRPFVAHASVMVYVSVNVYKTCIKPRE